ncbi:MAG TPA: L-histidine N(alpha)-methyltransferase [Gemmatimonadaceae bacterium]|nr:L-histidine N(alpha)-methyltransferase [Gemmatimonadaceae bacterium]
MTAIRPVARGPHIETPEEAQKRLRREIHAGLRANPKTLPPKLFYDDTGARLFEEITKLDEYYVTRTEHEIMEAHAAEMAALIGPNALVIEPGSGEAIKVRVLLDHLENPAAYVPIDISAEQLARVARELTEEYETLDVIPLEADFTRGLCLPELPDTTRNARRVAFFPGSTIGNLHPPQAVALLREIARIVGPRGGLLLGVDLRKDPTILHAAYNDARRVTAVFNKNALVRLNREFAATFDVDRFRHYAYYNPVANRVEMHLVSLETHEVVVDGERILFEQGEPIWTESSYKYSPAELEGCAREAGLVLRRMWCDRRQWFMVAFFEVAATT